MRNNEIKYVKTCGKLYISGEYSVLYENQSAIIKNINIFMYGKIHFSKEYSIYSDMFGYVVNTDYDKNYFLIQSTIKIMENYLGNKGYNIKPFTLEITGKMEENGKKYGIGSSGSVVILVIKSIGKLYNVNIDENTIFKLAVYTLLKNGDNGSMGDIACISYENLILYKGFDKNKILEMMKINTLEKVLEEEWGYEINVINCNVDCDFLVGWTKEVALSKNMINSVKSSINELFLNETEKCVQNLKFAFNEGNIENIKKYISKNDDLLKKLNNLIYSEKLLKLVECTKGLNAVAKSSGAGGGDCGIAISFNEEDSEKIVRKWNENNIKIIYKERLK